MSEEKETTKDEKSPTQTEPAASSDGGVTQTPPTILDAGNTAPTVTDAGNTQEPATTDAGNTQGPATVDAGHAQATTTDAGNTTEPTNIDGGASSNDHRCRRVTVSTCTEPITELFISEYIEGTDNNQLIEIYNGTDQIVSLQHYSLKKAVDGGDWELMQHLSPTAGYAVYPGDVFYVCHPNAALPGSAGSPRLPSHSMATMPSGLFFREQAIDVIGQVGENPGDGWIVGDGSTQDHTLVRNHTFQKALRIGATASHNGMSTPQTLTQPSNTISQPVRQEATASLF